MNDKHTEKEPGSGESLFEIFADVTPRAKPRPEAEERAFAVLESQWKAQTMRRRRTRLAAWSIAASLLVAIGFAYNWTGDGSDVTPQPVAQVARLAGEAIYVNNEIVRENSAAALAFSAGDSLRTGAGSRVSLIWGLGGSLRIDQESELSFVSPGVVRLAGGSVYFDSLPHDRTAREGPAVTVETIAGRISHVGTQFVTSANGDDVTISVREGQVLIDGPKFNFLARPRDRLVIDADGLQSKHLIDTYDESWRWAEEIAPPFDPAGRTAAELATWISRETGRPLRYVSASAEANANSTKLIGLDDLNPVQALRAMPFATDLRYAIVGEEIVIRLDSDER